MQFRTITNTSEELDEMMQRVKSKLDKTNDAKEKEVLSTRMKVLAIYYGRAIEEEKKPVHRPKDTKKY